jgi:uncharacterized repeat protein (TIGR01451 family)
MKHLKIIFALLCCGAWIATASTERITTDLVNLTKSAPDRVGVGETYEVTLNLTAVRDVGGVVISDRVPEGAELKGSDPKADVNGDRLTWRLPSLNAGDSYNIKLSLAATREGEVASCATISVNPRACVTTFVGRPVLGIDKSGPETALLGSDVTYKIAVSNTGSGVARNVVVTDQVPDGLTHESGKKELTWNLGDIPAKESRELLVRLTANERGRFCNKAIAASSNAGSVNDDACTQVLKQELIVNKTGSELQFIGKNASYNIEVRNPGDTALTNVVVRDDAPAGTRIVDAPGATVSGNSAVWTIASIEAGKKVDLKLVLTSRQAGNLCNNVSVATAEGLNGNSQACTEWKGHPALLLEVIDTVDPLLPGEETTYVIRVTNQGTADDHNVAVKALYPAQISPVSAAGHTETQVKGKNVTVTPYPVLAPGQYVEWQIKAKAEVAGDSRLHVELTSKLLKTPVKEEESTHVY